MRLNGRVANAKNQLAAFLEHDIGGAGDEVVADAIGDGGERAHGAGNDDHGVDVVAAGSDGGANIFVGDGFDFLVKRGPECGWEVASNRRR